MPPGLIDFGTADELMKQLQPELLIDALKTHPNVLFRWQQDETHGLVFVKKVIADHFKFHAQHFRS